MAMSSWAARCPVGSEPPLATCASCWTAPTWRSAAIHCRSGGRTRPAGGDHQTHGRAMNPDDRNLSASEAAVWDAAQTGDVVDLRAHHPEIDRPDRCSEWADSRTVRAEVLITLLVGEAGAPSVHRKGVRLRGAKINGALDLEASTLRCPLELLDCYFERVLILEQATAVSVRLG